MARQIGWSNEANLLYEISLEIDKLIKIAGSNTTTSTTTLP